MNVLFDRNADLDLIRGKKVAIFGYGNQGRPQALNLRDSGVRELIVSGRPNSESCCRAREDGFDVMPSAEAAAWADVLVILVPDEAQPTLFSQEVAENLRPGSALVFAHGLNIHFQLIDLPDECDAVLVAPKGPGTALREEYLKGRGLVSLYAVAKDSSGSAEALALSYAAALGSGRAGIINTSFREECEADLFNEQAVIWGAVPELILAGYETLVEAGFSPEVAYFECVTEVKLIADLIYARGLAGMREAISNTAEFGALEGGRRIITPDTRTEMRRILREVRSGQFTQKLINEAAAGYPRLTEARLKSKEHPIEQVGKKLRDLTG